MSPLLDACRTPSRGYILALLLGAALGTLLRPFHLTGELLCLLTVSPASSLSQSPLHSWLVLS